nr:MAG TPA: hypothetical protein [Caudoviricetes sp.]
MRQPATGCVQPRRGTPPGFRTAGTKRNDKRGPGIYA